MTKKYPRHGRGSSADPVENKPRTTLPPGPGKLNAKVLPANFKIMEWYGVNAAVAQLDLAVHMGGDRTHFEVRPGWAPDVVHVELVETVPDRDTAKPVQKGSVETIILPVTVAELTARLRGMLLLNVQHELDESIKFQNVRVFDPHAGEPAFDESEEVDLSEAYDTIDDGSSGVYSIVSKKRKRHRST